MNKYFSHIDYFATGEGRFVNISGGNFVSEDAFYKYLERRIDPFYLKFVDVYTFEKLPDNLLSLLKLKYPTDLHLFLDKSGGYRFMHEFYLNVS